MLSSVSHVVFRGISCKATLLLAVSRNRDGGLALDAVPRNPNTVASSTSPPLMRWPQLAGQVFVPGSWRDIAFPSGCSSPEFWFFSPGSFSLSAPAIWG